MAGYSLKPLVDKLGIRDHTRVLLVNQPPDYFQWLGKDISSQVLKNKGVPDLVHLFAYSKKEFEQLLQKILPLTVSHPAIVIWVSWLKKSSGMAADLTETDIRNYALLHQLVDIKVCAVSNDWSGLKLVVPLKKRAG